VNSGSKCWAEMDRFLWVRKRVGSATGQGEEGLGSKIVFFRGRACLQAAEVMFGEGGGRH